MIFDINFTDNIEEIERQEKDFNQLPYSLRKRSNEEAIVKYGKPYPELFQIMKASSVSGSNQTADIELDNSIISEAFLDIDSPTSETEITQDKINKVYTLNTQGIYVIAPICSLKIYSMDELQYLFDRYNMGSAKLKDIADQESIALFGKNVFNMYHINKLKIASMNQDTSGEIEIDSYASVVSEVTDPLQLLKIKIDLDNTEKSIMESVFVDRICEQVTSKMKSVTNYAPSIIPNLYPTEIESLSDHMDDRDIEYLNYYKDSLQRGLVDFDSSEYERSILDIFNEKDKDMNQKLIKRGWNPNAIPRCENGIYTSLYTFENFKYMDRMMPKVNEISEVQIIDVHEYVNTKPINSYSIELQPVYVVLSYTDTVLGNIINKVKKSEYAHAALSFDESLEKMYTYAINNDYNGISIESVNDYKKRDKNAKIKVLSLFVTDNQKERILSKLNYFIDNQDRSKYSIENLFKILFNKKYNDEYNLKLVCSQFVDSLLRFANIELFPDKANNLVSPSDFEKSKNPKLFVVYEGLVSKYDSNKVKIIVDALRIKPSNAIKLALESTINTICTSKDLIEVKSIDIKEFSNNDLNKLESLLVAESCIVESKEEKATPKLKYNDYYRFNYNDLY